MTRFKIGTLIKDLKSRNGKIRNNAIAKVDEIGLDNIKSIPKLYYAYNYAVNQNTKPKGKRIGFIYDKNITFKQHVEMYFEMSVKDYKVLCSCGCSHCGSRKNMNLHHIKPKSQGGSNNITNLQPLCKSCHMKVHDRTW